LFVISSIQWRIVTFIEKSTADIQAKYEQINENDDEKDSTVPTVLYVVKHTFVREAKKTARGLFYKHYACVIKLYRTTRRNYIEIDAQLCVIINQYKGMQRNYL